MNVKAMIAVGFIICLLSTSWCLPILHLNNKRLLCRGGGAVEFTPSYLISIGVVDVDHRWTKNVEAMIAVGFMLSVTSEEIISHLHYFYMMDYVENHTGIIL